MKYYTSNQVADLLDQAIKLRIQIYRENTIADIEVLVKQELLKLLGNKI